MATLTTDFTAKGYRLGIGPCHGSRRHCGSSHCRVPVRNRPAGGNRLTEHKTTRFDANQGEEGDTQYTKRNHRPKP